VCFYSDSERKRTVSGCAASAAASANTTYAATDFDKYIRNKSGDKLTGGKDNYERGFAIANGN
jgi:hypothetical protein